MLACALGTHGHTYACWCDVKFSRTDDGHRMADAEVCPVASGQSAAHQPHVCGVSSSQGAVFVCVFILFFYAESQRVRHRMRRSHQSESLPPGAGRLRPPAPGGEDLGGPVPELKNRTADTSEQNFSEKRRGAGRHTARRGAGLRRAGSGFWGRRSVAVRNPRPGVGGGARFSLLPFSLKSYRRVVAPPRVLPRPPRPGIGSGGRGGAPVPHTSCLTSPDHRV